MSQNGMSSKSVSHLHPVTERKLRNIYDALDNGNFKKALQEADRALKKHPLSQCAKALKCLALLRLGKESESMEQLEAVRREVPVEDSTLQAMTVCYRELHKPELICEIYKGANEKEPRNEELQVHLFQSYVRVSDYTKQHQTGMALFRLKSKNQYCFWAAMSILLQAVDQPSDILQFCVPPLCTTVEELLSSTKKWEDSQISRLIVIEKMLERNRDKFDSEQEVLFYMTILEMQGKYSEALNHLGSSLGEKLDHTTKVNKKVALLMKLERWQEAIVLLKSLILENPDSWSHIVHYIEAVFRLYDLTCTVSTVETAHEFLCSLNQNKKSSQGKRGPSLALLELQAHLERRKLTKLVPCDGLVKLMVQYIVDFGSSECCVRDLKKYALLLTQDEIKDFLNQVWTLVGLEHGTEPKDRKQMLIHLSNMELFRVFGFPTNGSPEECKEAVLSLLKFLHCGQQFNSKVPETEIRSCDRYALLAAHIMYDLWSETNVAQCLFEGIVICQYALNQSPSNSQLKLLQLKFYHLLGGTLGAHDAYDSLDIKHMQLDTLGYFHALPLIKNGHYSLAGLVLSTTRRFFSSNFKDSAEHITYAYRYEAYMKIPDCIDIREKINNSVHYMHVTWEKMLLDILLSPNFNGTVQVVNEMEVSPQEDKIIWGKLRDNRDFSVLWELDHQSRCITQNAIETTLNHEIVLLRLRQISLRIIVAIVQMGSGQNDKIENIGSVPESEYGTDYTSFDRCGDGYPFIPKATIIELTSTLENSLKALKRNCPTAVSRVYISSPPSSRLLIMLDSKYIDQMLDMLKFFISVVPGKDSSISKSQFHLAASMLYLDELLRHFSSELNELDNYSLINDFLQKLSLYTEIISFSYIIVGACDHILKRIVVSVKKTKKKKDSHIFTEPSQDMEWRVEMVSAFTHFLAENLGKVVSLMKEVLSSFPVIKSILGEVNIIQEVQDETEKRKLFNDAKKINDIIISSYTSCIEEMISVLRLKSKYSETTNKH